MVNGVSGAMLCGAAGAVRGAGGPITQEQLTKAVAGLNRYVADSKYFGSDEKAQRGVLNVLTPPKNPETFGRTLSDSPWRVSVLTVASHYQEHCAALARDNPGDATHRANHRAINQFMDTYAGASPPR
jgi:hypothetical protein